MAEPAAAPDHQLAWYQAELTRLRAGEDLNEIPEGTWPTPGAWIRRFNEATAEDRLRIAALVLEDADRASRCFLMDHDRRIDQAQADRARAWADADAMRRTFLDACRDAEDAGEDYVKVSRALIAAIAAGERATP